MTRVKRGVTARRRHKKVIKEAKSYRGKRSSNFRFAKNAVMKAGMNAYRDRKLRKREFRRLWITRISAGLSEYDMKYSRFIDALTKADIQIDRKILADLALNNSDAFKAVVEQAKDSAEAKPEAKSAAKEATKEAAPKPVAKAA